jgi:hypothetical protein
MEKRGDEWSAESFFTSAPGPFGETFVTVKKGEGDLGPSDGGSVLGTENYGILSSNGPFGGVV